MPKQPNILLIFTDQQRFDTIAALGNPIIKTPALDRLAREGTAFTRCYTPSPVCISARHALVTGKLAHETGCYDNMPMPEDYPSFMERLADLGYQTHGVGKMHFAGREQLWGFEKRLYSAEGGRSQNDYVDFVKENGFGWAGAYYGWKSEYYYIPKISQLPPELHESHWVVDRSIDFLRDRDKDRPFFLWSSFIDPHPPFDNPVPWHNLYRAAEMSPPFRPEGYENLITFWNRIQNRYKYGDAGFDNFLLRTMRAAYYASISFIDWNLNRLFDALGDEADNTLILFTADHGEMLGDYGSFGKRCMLEPAAHVPMLARWPGRFEAGARRDAPVSLIDVFPTFLQAAGADDIRPSAEAESLFDVAAGQTDRQYVFSQIGAGKHGLYLITDGRWKYIYSAADEKEWLFDLHTDPRETHSLAYNAMFMPKVEELRAALIDELAGTGYAVADGEWRKYGKAEMPGDADLGMLFQDPPDLQGRINALGEGYARDVTVRPEDAGVLLRMMHEID